MLFIISPPIRSCSFCMLHVPDWSNFHFSPSRIKSAESCSLESTGLIEILGQPLAGSIFTMQLKYSNVLGNWSPPWDQSGRERLHDTRGETDGQWNFCVQTPLMMCNQIQYIQYNCFIQYKLSRAHEVSHMQVKTWKHSWSMHKIWRMPYTHSWQKFVTVLLPLSRRAMYLKRSALSAPKLSTIEQPASVTDSLHVLSTNLVYLAEISLGLTWYRNQGCCSSLMSMHAGPALNGIFFMSEHPERRFKEYV